MNINFEWHSTIINDSLKEHIEESMYKELNSNQDNMKTKPKELSVTIFDVPNSQKLSGSAIDETNKEVVTFSHSISSGETRYTF